MSEMISKSKFKARALEYFRLVERTGREIVITNHGRPVLKIVPFSPDPLSSLRSLKGTVLSYEDPLEPVGEEWEVES